MLNGRFVKKFKVKEFYNDANKETRDKLLKEKEELETKLQEQQRLLEQYRTDYDTIIDNNILTKNHPKMIDMRANIKNNIIYLDSEVAFQLNDIRAKLDTKSASLEETQTSLKEAKWYFKYAKREFDHLHAFLPTIERCLKLQPYKEKLSNYTKSWKQYTDQLNLIQPDCPSLQPSDAPYRQTFDKVNNFNIKEQIINVDALIKQELKNLQEDTLPNETIFNKKMSDIDQELKSLDINLKGNCSGTQKNI